ncbi:MAG: tyrosine--tRNA ligase [Deltaproteobacteria bacterium]|nr:tyrosine--tRNA ligase [Deltaproteobacteria bacterium]
MSVLDVLQSRGFVEAVTHQEELADLLNQEEVVCYIGFDPTADSLHVGSLVPIMALCHMQRAGHHPIALLGGGTGLVGDPSGKTEMRKLLDANLVEQNCQAIAAQLGRFLDFSKNASVENNADWLLGLKYIPFLRDIGRHFSVNRMLKAESCRLRLESEEGLSFIEFNYMLLQAYDFLKLFDRRGCRLQMGGSDQWGNIVAGVDLIRRVRGQTAFGITFPLITTSSGAKMGKTAKGAVWLSPEKTSPYEYFQYWVNTHDDDVARFLCLFTFLPGEEIEAVESLSGQDLNPAKAVLAFEATALAHGTEAADEAFSAAAAMFGGWNIPAGLLPSSSIPRKKGAADKGVPTTAIPRERLEKGIPAFELFAEVGLCASRGAARRLLAQGGGYVNDRRVEAFDQAVTLADAVDGALTLRAGKKRHHRVVEEK